MAGTPLVTMSAPVLKEKKRKLGDNPAAQTLMCQSGFHMAAPIYKIRYVGGFS